MDERMYRELADWWTLLSAVEDYAEEAAFYRATLLERATPRPRTLLELGSGGGNNAFHLKADFELTLVDLSEDMLRQSRKINPELEHVCGDMRDVRLGRVFDAVFVHDAISYMTTRADLARALETAWVHCRSGGVAIFAPDETRESFAPSTSWGGHDRGARGLRYLEWSWDPDPGDETALSDYAFLLRDESGAVRVVHDRHVHGVFSRQVWLDAIASVGFEPSLTPWVHSEVDGERELFVGRKR